MRLGVQREKMKSVSGEELLQIVTGVSYGEGNT